MRWSQGAWSHERITFFDKRLLDSQLAILDEPQPHEAVVIDQNRPLTEVVHEVLHHVSTLGLKPT